MLGCTYDDGAPVREVLIEATDLVGVPQKDVAELLGVLSTSFSAGAVPTGRASDLRVLYGLRDATVVDGCF